MRGFPAKGDSPGQTSLDKFGIFNKSKIKPEGGDTVKDGNKKQKGQTTGEPHRDVPQSCFTGPSMSKVA